MQLWFSSSFFNRISWSPWSNNKRTPKAARANPKDHLSQHTSNTLSKSSFYFVQSGLHNTQCIACSSFCITPPQTDLFRHTSQKDQAVGLRQTGFFEQENKADSRVQKFAKTVPCKVNAVQIFWIFSKVTKNGQKWPGCFMSGSVWQITSELRTQNSELQMFRCHAFDEFIVMLAWGLRGGGTVSFVSSLQSRVSSLESLV